VGGDAEIAERVDLSAVFDQDAFTRHADVVFERLRGLTAGRREEAVHV